MSSNTPTPLSSTEDSNLIPATDDIALWFAKNRALVLAAAAVIIIGGGGTAFWFIHSHNTRLASEAALSNATNAQGWQEVISKYPNTIVAGDASLLLAEAQAKEGKIDESTATLQAFVKAQPEHPLAGAARYGIGENYRQQGKLPEALEAFRSVRTESAGSYAAPLAQLSEARVLVLEKKTAEALQTFDSVASQFPGTAAGQIARAEAERLRVSGVVEVTAQPEAPKPPTP